MCSTFKQSNEVVKSQRKWLAVYIGLIIRLFDDGNTGAFVPCVFPCSKKEDLAEGPLPILLGSRVVLKLVAEFLWASAIA